MASVPVTVLTGTKSSADARVFEHILAHTSGKRVAAIVPKRGSGKKKTIAGIPLLPTTEQLVDMGNGCSCCMVRADLMAKIRKITSEETVDHIVICAEKQADLVILAKTFTVANKSGAVLSEVARIESMVMVVDARSLLSTSESPPIRSLIERIELANVLVIEGAKDLDSKDIEQVVACLSLLNPGARIMRDNEGDLSLDSVRAKRPFALDLDKNRTSLINLVPQSGETNRSIERFTYRARHPFHPKRLHDVLTNHMDDVLRAKGIFWVASRPHDLAQLDVAGGHVVTTSEGVWWASVSPEQRPQNDAFRRFMRETWDEVYGDRIQEFTLVGFQIDEESLTAKFDNCLLTNEELSEPQNWVHLEHPFPWPIQSL